MSELRPEPALPADSASPFPRWEAARGARAPGVVPEVGSVFMPLPGEQREAYLERLLGLQLHLEALIGATRRGLAAQRPTGAPAAVPEALRAVAVGPASAPAVSGPTAPPARPLPAPPAPTWPQGDRRVQPAERRAGPVDRRLGLDDRRRGRPDMRLVREERRAGPAERRLGAVDRRRGGDRRRSARQAALVPAIRFDLTTLFWAVQVVAWVTVAVIVLVYGIGN